MSKKTSPGTSSVKPADEAAALGQWEGFATEQLVTEEGAAQLLEHRRNLANAQAADRSTTTNVVWSQPFRWKEKVFRIIRADYSNGQALVEAVPQDDEFMGELKRRIEQDRFHTLNVYLGFGYVCFPEDYSKYQ